MLTVGRAGGADFNAVSGSPDAKNDEDTCVAIEDSQASVLKSSSIGERGFPAGRRRCPYLYSCSAAAVLPYSPGLRVVSRICRGAGRAGAKTFSKR